MIHVVALEALLLGIIIHPSQTAQIDALQQNKISTKVPPEYAVFADVFSSNLAIELPENTSINKHAIKLEDSKQPSYGLIYSLGPVKLETLKTYIGTHLKTGFIWPSKSPAGVSILFYKKPDDRL